MDYTPPNFILCILILYKHRETECQNEKMPTKNQIKITKRDTTSLCYNFSRDTEDYKPVIAAYMS